REAFRYLPRASAPQRQYPMPWLRLGKAFRPNLHKSPRNGRSGHGGTRRRRSRPHGVHDMLSRLKEWTTRQIAVIVVALVAATGLPNADLHAQEYTAEEILDAGHRFFGATSGGLGTAIENIFASYGLPNGYVLGEEGSAALFGGLTYGEGTLYTKNAGDHKVFWQGPSLGWDFGGQGSRTMMLVYNLDDVPNLYHRFAGVAGSAYAVAGVGFNVLKREDVLLVPV